MTGRRLTRIPIAVAFAAGLALASAAFVLGYWAAGGVGTAAASVASFAPPSGVTAALPDPVVRTVHVAWTGHPAPDGGASSGFYVERVSGGVASPACGSSPASPLPGTAMACDDTGVASGIFTYVVTSIFRTWTASSAPSDPVSVPGPALASFTVSPSTTSTTAGAPFTLTVTAFDQYGAVFTGYVGAKCVTLSGPQASPGGALPSYPAADGCAAGSSVSFTSGVATIPVTLVDVDTTAITVTDSPTSRSGTSDAITVVHGPEAGLAFTRQPSTPTTAGVVFATQPEVAVQDAYGNTVTGSTSPITLAVTGGGASVTSCTTNPLAATAGVASFSACRVAKAGTWTLAATSGSLAAATSATFTITSGPAATIAVSSGSGQSAAAGTAFGSPLVALVGDAFGNPVSGTTVTFTAPGSGATGTFPGPTVSATAATDATGLATAPVLTASTTSGAFEVVASAGGAGTVPFALAVTAGPAAKLAFTRQPSATATAGSALATQPVVAVQDAYGNMVTTDTSAVSVASVGSGLTCTANPVDAVAGVVTFTGCAMTAAGSWQLTATSGALDPATSSAVTVLAGPAAALAFTQQPSGAVQNLVFPTQPKVGITDAYGNAVTDASASITLAITPGTGTSGATLACTANPLATVAGVAAFAGCSINLVGTNYRLRAIGGGFALADSSTFNIGNGASTTTVVASGAPQNATVATAFLFPLVARVMDAYGSPVPGVSVTFTAPAAGATGRFGASATVTRVTDSSGLATAPVFTAGTIAGTYTVTANAPGTTTAGFDLTNVPGPASRLAFTQQPSGSTVAGTAFARQPVVTIQDAYNNTVTTDTSAVTLAITGGAAAISCTSNPVYAVAGVATFGGCTVTRAGTGYSLLAIDGTLAAATSSTFAITAAAASTLAVSSGSGQAATVNTGFASRLVALVTDTYGNPVSGVTVAFTAPADPGATFGASSAGSAVSSTSGLATSPAVTADTTAGSYQVIASAPGTTSAAFDLTNLPGAATQLLFQDDPSSSLPDIAFGTQPTVVIADTYGNAVTTASATVALAITAGTGTAGAALACTANPLATASGVAAFAGCSVSLEGLGYTLTATGGGYTAALSAPFDITPQLRPASLALTNGAGLTRGLMETGDRMVIRYSGTLMASTMCADWTSDTTAYTIADGTITLTGRGSPSNRDMVTVSTGTSCGGAFNLGYIDLGTTRVSGNTSTVYSWNATIAWDPATGSLTVTIGTLTSGSAPARVRPSVSARYYPSLTLTDPLATPIAGTALWTRKVF